MGNEIIATESGYLATVKVADGLVRFAFEEVEQPKSGDLSAETIVWREIPGIGTNPFSCRMNTQSLSARETLRRALDDAWGQGGWSRHIGQACSLLKAAWRSRERDKWIEHAEEPEEERFCLEPYLLARGPTVWFGDAGTGKTTSALWCAKQLGCVVMWLDFEWEESEIKRIWRGISGAPASLRYWNAEGGSLADEAHSIRRDIRKSGAEYCVVDSAAAAADGEPERADVTNRFFNALQHIGMPSLTIAHVNNAGEDQRPFGCHDEETEVLTLRGWQRHADLRDSDYVACFDPQSEELRWEKPEAYHEYDYAGPMYELGGRSRNALVTPNHRILIRDKRIAGRRWRFVEAQDIRQQRFLTQIEGPLARRMRETVAVLDYESARRELIFRYSRHVRTLPYWGKVYCLTVPSGAYVTRRHGSVTITGNSRFWYHRGRLLWNIKGDRETEGELRQGFFCRKANVGAWPKPFGMLIAYRDRMDVSNGYPLWREFGDQQATTVRIRELLSRGQMQRRDIAQELGLTDAAIRKALQRMPDTASDGRSPYANWWIKAG